MLLPCHCKEDCLMFYHIFSDTTHFADSFQCLVINVFDGLRVVWYKANSMSSYAGFAILFWNIYWDMLSWGFFSYKDLCEILSSNVVSL